MTIDGKLLEILCCPISKSPVKRLSSRQLKALNTELSKGTVKNIGGAVLKTPLQEGLVTQSGQIIYPVESGIPVMLEENGIHTSQLPDGIL